MNKFNKNPKEQKIAIVGAYGIIGEAASKILVSDRNYTGASKITGTFEFNICPTLPAASLADAALSANVPLKNALNTFSVKQSFSAGIDLLKSQAYGFIAEKVATLPEGASDRIGQIVYCTGDSKFYGWDGTAWRDLGYVGAYSGGAVRSYTASLEVDDGDSDILWFKTEGASPTVKIALQGLIFPRRYYTELGQHTHTFTPAVHDHDITEPDGGTGHTHVTDIGAHAHGSKEFALSTHTHSIGITSGNQSVSHYHQGVQEDSGTTTNQTPTNHTHSVSGTTGTPSASDNVDSATIGNKTSGKALAGIIVNEELASGTIENTGINAGSLSSVQKQYGHALIVKIDGTAVTSNILSATGWSEIGDGTGTHAFHTNGTSEMDASAWKSYAAGFHTLEIIEPEPGYGCRVMAHIETS